MSAGSSDTAKESSGAPIFGVFAEDNGAEHGLLHSNGAISSAEQPTPGKCLTFTALEN
jgi:hypothetical protein